MIHLHGLTFRYNARYVLKGLDFSMEPGDRLGVVGPNGSGKTTLALIIMGLLIPEAGEVEIFGRPRVSDADFIEVRRRIGFLFQDPDDQLFCPTVLEDVAFGPLNLDKPHDEVRRIVSSTLETLRLTGYENRVTHQLSGGEKRLVSLATVLAMEPEMLMLDEPTSGLDEETTERLIGVLTGSDLSYMVISHDRDFLARTTTKQFLMRDGRLTELGTPVPCCSTVRSA